MIIFFLNDLFQYRSSIQGSFWLRLEQTFVINSSPFKSNTMKTVLSAFSYQRTKVDLFNAFQSILKSLPFFPLLAERKTLCRFERYRYYSVKYFIWDDVWFYRPFLYRCQVANKRQQRFLWEDWKLITANFHFEIDGEKDMKRKE